MLFYLTKYYHYVDIHVTWNVGSRKNTYWLWSNIPSVILFDIEKNKRFAWLRSVSFWINNVISMLHVYYSFSKSEKAKHRISKPGRAIRFVYGRTIVRLSHIYDSAYGTVLLYPKLRENTLAQAPYWIVYGKFIAKIWITVFIHLGILYNCDHYIHFTSLPNDTSKELSIFTLSDHHHIESIVLYDGDQTKWINIFVF